MGDVQRIVRISTSNEVLHDIKPTVAGFPMRRWKLTVTLHDSKHDKEINANIFEKVIYRLHPTFANPIRTVKTPPFTLEEQGWGEFDLGIVLVLADKAGEYTITHDLNFQKQNYVVDKVLSIPTTSTKSLSGGEKLRKLLDDCAAAIPDSNVPSDTFLDSLTLGPNNPASSQNNFNHNNSNNNSNNNNNNNNSNNNSNNNNNTNSDSGYTSQKEKKRRHTESDHSSNGSLTTLINNSKKLASDSSNNGGLSGNFDKKKKSSLGLSASNGITSSNSNTLNSNNSNPALAISGYGVPGIDMEKLSSALQRLGDDDLLQIVRMVTEGKSPSSFVRNNADEGEFHMDLYTLPDALIKKLWDFTKKRLSDI